MILLLTIGTVIPQTRLTPYYNKVKEYHPEKNVSRYTVLYAVYDIVLVLIYNRQYKTIVFIISGKGNSC